MNNLLIFSLLFPLFAGCNEILPQIEEPEDKLQKIYNLPGELRESSGIVIYDSMLWTFNDSGNDNAIYALDMDAGNIVKRFTLNAENHDWEDIAQDSVHIYIGDFGNNYGNREDLCIYIVDKQKLDVESQEPVEVERINFHYEEQTDFTEQLNSGEYDCESLFVLGDSLYLFTKNWASNTTKLYQLPTTPGDYKAKLIDTYESDGLITGADFDPDTKELVICGYKQYVPYVIHFEQAEKLNLASISRTRTDLLDHFGLQVEGVTIRDNVIYLSAEKSLESPAFFRITSE